MPGDKCLANKGVYYARKRGFCTWSLSKSSTYKFLCNVCQLKAIALLWKF